MLLQGFTKLSRNFSCKLSLKKPVMKDYEKHAKRFHLKFYREIENVKKYFRNLAKIFHERLQGNLSKRFSVSLPETVKRTFRNVLNMIMTS